MAFGLTVTLTRPIIDHTGEAPQSAPIPFGGVRGLRAPHDEPPTKRRRVDETTPTKHRPMKDCLRAQVLPHVSKAVASLDRRIHRVNDIAVQVWDSVGTALGQKLTIYPD